MKISSRIKKMTPTQLAEMAAVLGVTHDGTATAKEIETLHNKVQRVLVARGVKDHIKVIADHPVEQEKPPKYLYEIKELSCFGRLFDATSTYCVGKCGFAEECVNTLERLALQVQQGQRVLTATKKGRSIMALKKKKEEEVPAKKSKKTPVEAEAPKKIKKSKEVEVEAPKKAKKSKEVEAEAPKKKAAKEVEAPAKKVGKKAPVEEAPAKGKKGAKEKGGTGGATKVKVIEPFGDGRFLKVIAEKNPLQKKDTAFDLATTLVEMGNGAKSRRLTQAQFFNAINQHFVLPEDEAKATAQIKEVAEELKQKSVAKIVLLKAE